MSKRAHKKSSGGFKQNSRNLLYAGIATLFFAGAGYVLKNSLSAEASPTVIPTNENDRSTARAMLMQAGIEVNELPISSDIFEQTFISLPSMGFTPLMYRAGYEEEYYQKVDEIDGIPVFSGNFTENRSVLLNLDSFEKLFSEVSSLCNELFGNGNTVKELVLDISENSDVDGHDSLNGIAFIIDDDPGEAWVSLSAGHLSIGGYAYDSTQENYSRSAVATSILSDELVNTFVSGNGKDFKFSSSIISFWPSDKPFTNPASNEEMVSFMISRAYRDSFIGLNYDEYVMETSSFVIPTDTDYPLEMKGLSIPRVTPLVYNAMLDYARTFGPAVYIGSK